MIETDLRVQCTAAVILDNVRGSPWVSPSGLSLGTLPRDFPRGDRPEFTSTLYCVSDSSRIPLGFLPRDSSPRDPPLGLRVQCTAPATMMMMMMMITRGLG
jgi:hypothetical protein